MTDDEKQNKLYNQFMLEVEGAFRQSALRALSSGASAETVEEALVGTVASVIYQITSGDKARRAAFADSIAVTILSEPEGLSKEEIDTARADIRRYQSSN